jgi:hypothetical protein
MQPDKNYAEFATQTNCNKTYLITPKLPELPGLSKLPYSWFQQFYQNKHAEQP